MRYFLEIAYKGTNYHGWQIQKNAVSVQQILEQKLSMLLRKSIEVVGSGRTDTGVHCLQQFVHMDHYEELDENFLFKLNCVLPKDIAVKQIRKVKPEIHARFDAEYREYFYRISTCKNPFLTDYSWQITRELNIGKMREATEKLLHFKDFESFSKVHTDVQTFECEIHHAFWEQSSDELKFTIRANRFLRGMVRAIVGTLVNVGLEKTSVNEFVKIIEGKDRRLAGAAAPPEGLFLTEVKYSQDIYLS